MNQSDRHKHTAAASFDGGDLDCGNGLLLLIRKHIDPLDPGQLLEIKSTEISVEEDLPAWCRLTKNDLVSWTKDGKQRSFLICKGPFARGEDAPSRRARARLENSDPPAKNSDHAGDGSSNQLDSRHQLSAIRQPDSLSQPIPAPEIPPGAVMGIGSWPRPNWLLKMMHEHLCGRMINEEFQHAADDAVRLAVSAQLRAGVDVVTDGEQRRDNYSSFVGGILDNCQLIPLIDLLPLVDDPEKFAAEMKALDVPADSIRHPAVFGRIARSRPLALHEFEFLKTLTDRPTKVALPGPYLLSRTMWLECISDKAYESRESLAGDIVRVLWEELHALLAAGVSLVQFDEPVLTEVVFAGSKNKRSFMCGALSERGNVEEELEFATNLLNNVVAGAPRDRVAIHICRGNWTPDESVALRGDYWPLLPVLTNVNVGTVFLEFCTPRAGDLAVIKELPAHMRVGIGVVNPKDPQIESVSSIMQKMQAAATLITPARLLFTPDCGFATFADNPVASAVVAEAKMQAIVKAIHMYGIPRSRYSR
jgi:5-methyltetrahydropteroyltriglutamate--homocysteine methyltransferase